MTEREELEHAIASLDRQRTVLGDAAVEAAVAGLRQKLSALEKGEAALPTLAGERRVVTILFCDIKGSTAMAGKLDPEEWAAIMKRAFAYLIGPVTRHEGTVARLMGDAILAFFGAPTTHEDDPQRAVRAGLEIIEGITHFREELQRERGLDFNVRVGINSGLVFVGAIGSDGRAEYTAMGDAINLAARMEQTARPGSVQIMEQTFKLVAPWFEFEALGGIEVKGKSEPVPTYRVLRVAATPARGRGLEGHGLSSPLVGRDQELEMLRSCVERLTGGGEGGIVGIIGEAGLGKSRLVAEAHTMAPNVLWLEGQTLSFGQTISYWPFQQIVRQWAGITEDDDAGLTWSKLEGRVQALFGEETISYLPYLASLLALEVQGEYAERVKYLDGEAMGKQIFLTVRRFFDRLARAQPTVLVFEDLHWMDESSTNLLEHLLPLAESAPLLIIGLSRPEVDTPAARLRELCARDFADHYTEIRLAPLSDADSAQLTHNLLAIEDLPVRLRGLIVEKAEGNPFFLEEVIRTLIDTGAVTRDVAGGRWRATAQIEAIHIPDTVQAVIIARVDRLGEEVKQVLRLASVIGRTFLYRVLKAMAEASQHLDDDLAELQQGEFIRAKQHVPELEYMFKHALAQEATYESILLQKRRELHARVAQALESLFAERLDEFYGLLAYHYARAEVWEKAQEYLLKAADQAGQLAGDVEALHLYDQALAAYAHSSSDNKWAPVQLAAVERKVGEALFRRGEHTQALEHFYRGIDYVGKRLPTSPGRVRRAIIRELIEQAGHRLLPGLFLKNATGSISPEFEEEYYLIEGIHRIVAFANVDTHLLGVVRTLNSVERVGFEYGIARASAGFAVLLDLGGASGIAEHYHRRAIALSEQVRNPNAVGFAYFSMATHVLLQGSLDLALEHARRAAEAYQEAGNMRAWGRETLLISGLLSYQGDLDNALQQGTSLLRVGQDAGDLHLECWGEVLQGVAQKRIGHLDEARANLERSIQLSDILPDYQTRVFASGELARCCLRQGDLDEALAALEAGEQIRAKYKRGGNSFTHLVHGQAEVYSVQAEQSSQSEKGEWLRKANHACQAALRQVKAFRPGAPEAMLLQGRYEWLRGKPEAARQWWNRSLAEADRMGMRYDGAMTHLEMGRRFGEREHLESAERTFAEIGAELDLASTRRLLEGREG